MTINKAKLLKVLMCAGLAVMFAGIGNAALAKKSDSRYPNATRSEPKNDMHSRSEQKKLQEGIDAINAGDNAKAQKTLQDVLDSSKSKYAQGVALEGLANLKFNEQDYKGAIEDYQKLLQLNSVPNDAYFDSMYNMANAYVGAQEYDKAMQTLKTWREQGKRDTPDSYALEGNIYYRQQKYDEAVAAIKKAQSMTDKPKDSWNSILMASLAASGKGGEAAGVIDKQLAKDPKNKQLAHNALVVYLQSKQTDKALALLDREQKDGMITDENDYVSAARFYASLGQDAAKPEIAAKGGALLQQGFDKGAVKPSVDNYKLMGDAYLIGNQEDKALAAYAKASPLASNGDIDYRRAEVMGAQQNWKEAKGVLEKGISRGVTHKGKAYLLLGKLDLALHNKAAARSAFEKAKQDSETSSDADVQLQKMRHKK